MNNIKLSLRGKKIKKKNGSDPVTIYGLTGAYRVKNQRYVLTDGRPSDYLSLCGNLTNGAYSKGLGEFIEEWSDDLSYEKMSKLLSQMTGSAVLSSSGIQSYLERKAESISQEWVRRATITK